MTIQVDTREHASEWERIQKQFDELGVAYYRSKLYVGDYWTLDNPTVVIDRKKDLIELCGNVCQQHKRFVGELERAREAGYRMVILCEHGGYVRDLEQVKHWHNPRTRTSPGATSGVTLYKILKTMTQKYDFEVRFCSKEETGRRIVEILGGGGHEQG